MAKRRKELKGAVIYVNRINEGLYRKVKFLAGIRDCTIRSVVEEALAGYLEKAEGIGGE